MNNINVSQELYDSLKENMKQIFKQQELLYVFILQIQ